VIVDGAYTEGARRNDRLARSAPTRRVRRRAQTFAKLDVTTVIAMLIVSFAVFATGIGTLLWHSH
jgi:hypothetical protein